MEAPASVELTRCDTGKTEIARIVTLDRETAKSRIDQAWWKELVSPLRDPTNEPDWDWEWRLLVSKRQNKWYFQSKCIVSQNGGVQAAIQFRVDAISAAKPDEQAVFVDRLATAPRNREGLTESPLYRGGRRWAPVVRRCRKPFLGVWRKGKLISDRSSGILRETRVSIDENNSWRGRAL